MMTDSMLIDCCFCALTAEAHGNAMASLQDNKSDNKRKQAAQRNLEKDLNERLKELDSLNVQLKVCTIQGI